MRRTSAAASRLVPLTIEGLAGKLEALIQEHESRDHALVVLLCHPHPLHGGTLHNKVVHRAAVAFHGLGAAVLRFNFRGVEKSEGRFDGEVGELEDARAALAFLAGRYPRARRWAAGFSFGSWIAARLAATEPSIERLVLIAPPARDPGFSVLESLEIPKLIVQGTSDEVCPRDVLHKVLPSWSEPRELIEVPGANHFFDRQLRALEDALRQGLSGPAGGKTSCIT